MKTSRAFTVPFHLCFKPTTRPETRWSELSCSVYDLGRMTVELDGIA